MLSYNKLHANDQEVLILPVHIRVTYRDHFVWHLSVGYLCVFLSGSHRFWVNKLYYYYQMDICVPQTLQVYRDNENIPVESFV